MTQPTLSRRSFLKASAVVAAGLSARSWGRVVGANSDIRVAVVGLNNHGRVHLKRFREVEGVRIAAICDCDSHVLDRAAQALRSDGIAVETAIDVRELLERKDIDVVSLATPNHQHALQTIWSCQAGKDVYVEKPVSHNIWEGRQMAAAATKFGRIVQAGTQNRSNSGVANTVRWVRSGQLGKITSVHGLCYKRRKSIGHVAGAPQPIPDTLNYDLWSGPAPMAPLLRENLHYDWHWVWSTGSGDLGNQGCHQLDIGRWFLGDPNVSRRTLSVGGRFGYEDDGETPNTQIVLFDYDAAPFIFEVRGLPASAGTEEMDNYHGASIGVVVTCEGGRVVVANRKIAAYDLDGRELKVFPPASTQSASHYANFIEAVRTQNATALAAPIDEGHLSSVFSHTPNISHRLGQAVAPGKVREQLVPGSMFAEAFDRMTAHLAANRVDLDKALIVQGAALNFDPVAERFIDHEAANALLTRNYRPPFIVPSLA